MKFKAGPKAQTQYLGVLKYKEGVSYGAKKIEIPKRWVEGSKEERMGRILQDLPEAAFRTPAHLTDTLRAIHAAIYEQYPDLREEPEQSALD